MNINIELTNINKHFLFNTEKGNNYNNMQKYKTKIIDLCFSSVNEANISDTIQNITDYINYYSIIEDYDFANIGEINNIINKNIIINNDDKYLIFKYKKENYLSFCDFLYRIESPKQFIFNCIDSFSHLLKSLIKLNENNICFFNLSSNNILFYLDKPIICNFQFSLQVLKLNNSYIENVIQNLNDFTNKPLEVHVLFYIIKNNLSSISYSFIEEICEVFVNNLNILNLFSVNYKYSYKLACIESLKKYLNLSKSDIIQLILEENEKWDIYSLSVIYLHIFGNFSRVFSLKQSFINNIMIELCKNINPEPSKRSNLKKLKETFDNFLNIDWSFVNKLSCNKMPLLLNELER
jgi:hypothetical protein